MGSSITPAAMTVTITETISINGAEQGGSQTLTVGSIKETFKRIVRCPANQDTTVALFQSAVSDNIESLALDTENIKYIRVTNLDDAESLNLSLQIDSGEDDSAADESATIQLNAKYSFIMGPTHDTIAVQDTNATIELTLHDLESILIDPGANDIDVEVFVASV